MNRTEFIAAVERLGINPLAYSLERDEAERPVLALVPGGWSVYYSQRHQRIGETFFDTEDEAFDWLLMQLASDLTAHRQRGIP